MRDKQQTFTQEELLAAGLIIDSDGNAIDPNDDEFYNGEDLGEGDF